jgi:hypothetical protein
MELVLWVSSLLLGLVARLASDREAMPKPRGRAYSALAIGALLGIAALAMPWLADHRIGLLGAVAGLVVAAADGLARPSRFSFPAAWLLTAGAVGLAYATVPAPDSLNAAVGVGAGLALGGALAGGPSAGVLTIGATSILWTVALGEAGRGREAALYGATVAVLAAFALLVFVALARGSARRLAEGGQWLVFLCLMGLVAIIARVSVPMPFVSILLGLLAPALVAWALPEGMGAGRGWSVGVAAALAIGASGVAFSEDKGFGVALFALFVAAVGVDRPRAWMALSPIWLFAGFRAFRSLHPDASRALDIGQNYAILGIVLGIVAVLAVVDWAAVESRPTPSFAPAAVLTLGVVLAGAALLGGKGAAGIAVGVALAPCVAGLRGDATLGVGRAAAAALGGLVLGYAAIAPFLDWRRPEKIEALIAIATAGALLAVATWWLGRPARVREATS